MAHPHTFIFEFWESRFCFCSLFLSSHSSLNDRQDKFGTTRVSLVQQQKFGRVLYLRNVKTNVGPAKFRLRLWTTQWVEELGEG
jgi:hypothetical protein